jgi:hypothetical protein
MDEQHNEVEAAEAKARGLLTRAAQGLLAEIRATQDGFARHVLAVVEMKESQAWRLLGFRSWSDFCVRELDRSVQAVDYLVRQGRELLESTPDAKAQVEAATAVVVPSRREAVKRQADRKRDEDPGPLPTEADRIAASSAKAKERRSLPRPEPTGPPSTKAAVAHLIDHLHDLHPADAAPVMSDDQAVVVTLWQRAMAGSRAVRRAAELGTQRRPLTEAEVRQRPERHPTDSDCPPHPVGRTIDDDCRHTASIGGPEMNYCFRCGKTVKGGRR